MKAVILAGGKGSRLRPITCDLPKPMARLCGRPILEYTLELLEKHGVTHAVMTLGYMPQVIKSHFEEKQFGSVKIEFSEEDAPLGTAGSVKKAADFSGDFIVISGDAMTDIDLSAALEFHRNNNADATLIVKKVDDPREYGLVNADKDGKITGFIEKPDYSQADSEFANTGIYILSERVLRMIPKNQNCDFAADIFPRMLQNGSRLFAYKVDGYWCDIGDISTYLSCQADMLTGKVKCEIKNNNIPQYPTVKILQPSYIGKDVTFGRDCVIGPNSVIDDCCYIGDGAKIKNSVLLEGAVVGESADVSGAIICSGASVKKKARIFERCVIGSDTVIGEMSQIKPNVKIWPEKHIADGDTVKCNIKYGDCVSKVCDGDVICGETLIDITPEFCVRLGAAAASMKKGNKLCVGYSGGRTAKFLKEAFTAGAASAGAQIWDIGESFAALCSFTQSFTGIEYGFFIESLSNTSIRMTACCGLPADRKAEREFMGILQQGSHKRCIWTDVRDLEDASGMAVLYRRELASLAPNGLEGLSARVEFDDKTVGKTLVSILHELGCEDGDDIVFKLSDSGTKLTIEFNEHEIDWCKAILLSMYENLENGETVSVSDDMPEIFDEIAKEMGGRILRYVPSNAADSDKTAREYGKKQLFVRDGLMMTVKILNYMKQHNASIYDMCVKLPDFSVSKDEVSISCSPGEAVSLLKELPNFRESEKTGVSFDFENGTGRVFSDKRGKKLKILTQAVNTEAAEEICCRIKSLIVNTLDSGGINR